MSSAPDSCSQEKTELRWWAGYIKSHPICSEVSDLLLLKNQLLKTRVMHKVQREQTHHVTTPMGQVKKGRSRDSDSSLVSLGMGARYTLLWICPEQVLVMACENLLRKTSHACCWKHYVRPPMNNVGYIKVRPSMHAARYIKVYNVCFLYNVSLLAFLICKMGGWWPVKRFLLRLMASVSGRFHSLHPKAMSSEPIPAAALGCSSDNLKIQRSGLQ